VNYRDVVEILKIAQERTARDDRFEAFKRAVSFYARSNALTIPEGGRGLILVAGTNGKGTVSKTLEVLLERAGHAVGLFTSPHLMEPTERIRTHGRDLSEEEMVRAYASIESTVQAHALSHFEILTLMMIEVFFGGRIREPVSRAVIEAGVGGRLDPTRVLPHETAVLTRIGLDHEAILGPTIEAIAREKLAIAEGARRLVYLKPPPELEAVFEAARLENARSARHDVECEFIEARTFESEIASGPRWIIKTPWGSAPLSLLGNRAVQNTSLALEVLARTDQDAASVLPALSDVVWPGRMERRSFFDRDVFLSGDHNVQGIESLADLLNHFSYEKLWLVVGIGKGKPLAEMLSHYRKIPRATLTLTQTGFRPFDEDELRRQGEAVELDALKAVKEACEKAGPRDMIVVSGSLYLVGDLRKHSNSARSSE
jgi:dihydrofolate synthase/folylpolyglutamate synthase